MPFLPKSNHPSQILSKDDELKHSLTVLTQIFELSSIGMAVVSLEGKWIKVNQHLCNMFGYSEKELIGNHFNDITYVPDKKLGSEKVKEMLDGVFQSFEIEKRYIHKKGHLVNTLLNSTLVRDVKGQPIYFISQTKDISAFKHSMEALRLSEEKFRLLFEKAPIGITHFDALGNITLVNQVIVDILGSTAEKITSVNTRKNIKDKNQQKAFEEALQGRVGHFEGEYTSITGNKTAFLKAVYAPLFDKEKQVIGGIGISQDITNQKDQEKKLIASIHEKELLLKEVYHRVKNNLQTVISLINIQMSESNNEAANEILRETKSRLFAMSKVHEVLCNTGNFTTISLREYINNLVNNFDFPNTSYHLKVEQEILLSVDQTNALGIMVNELITNSIKHNPGQNLKIGMTFNKGDDDKLIFKYDDNGLGLPKEQLKNTGSLGMNLVILLTEDQNEGKVTVSKLKGYHVKIEFKIS